MGMKKKSGILIIYSFDGSEPFIPCSKEKAWETLCSIAAQEAYTVVLEQDEGISISKNKEELEIEVIYQSDNSTALYKFYEDYHEDDEKEKTKESE